MPTRKATAVWEGGIMKGTGRFKGESGAIDASYSFGTRFGETAGSNPEELLAAAEGACFSMALSGNLERAGTPATKIESVVHVTVEKSGDGFRITKMRIEVRANVPGADAAKFREIAEQTKKTCPVSQALSGIPTIELDAQLS
jgi:osmotically inducible protein OsmC